MKYICNDCNIEFEESIENKKLSKLVRSLILECPKCKSSFHINLSEQGKLQVERKAKINKIDTGSGDF